MPSETTGSGDMAQPQLTEHSLSGSSAKLKDAIQSMLSPTEHRDAGDAPTIAVILASDPSFGEHPVVQRLLAEL